VGEDVLDKPVDVVEGFVFAAGTLGAVAGDAVLTELDSARRTFSWLSEDKVAVGAESGLSMHQVF
jgi:hypothetical protein